MNDAGQERADRISSICTALALLTLLWTIVVIASNGFSVRVGGQTVFRSRDMAIPAVLTIGLLVVAFRTRRVDIAARMASLTDLVTRSAPAAAIVLAAATFAVAMEHGTYIAGGSDSYGYMSQAQLWAKGDLIVEQELARRVPWPHADATFAPLGYKQGIARGSIVPTYAPGYPLTMAPFVAIGGLRAGYLVVPLLGGWLVWQTYRLGERLVGPTAGLMSAALFAANPILTFQIAQPMSDVPVAAWWTASLVAASRGTIGSALVSGLMVAMAVLTRPNLVVLGLAPACVLWLAHAPHRFRALIVFAMAALPGAAGVAVLNNLWYGSPFLSGYGPLSDLYAWANVAPNLRRYAEWLFLAFSILPLAALLGPWSVLSLRPDDPGRRALLWGGVLLVLLGLGSYLPYGHFEDRSYLRFLLPVLPTMVALATATLVRISLLLPAPARTVACLVVCAVFAGGYVQVSGNSGVVTLRRGESRYERVGRLAQTVVPKEGVLMALQHSGSARIYADRLTVRWDLLDPAWLDRAVQWLAAEQRPAYILLDEFEEIQFKERFSPHSPLGALDWPPQIELKVIGTVRLYDPADRAKYLAGEPIPTRRVVER